MVEKSVTFDTTIVLEGVMDMNCYLITNENNECFIVDPGFDADSIIKHIDSRGYKVIGILLTHGHFDHISGITCYDVPVYINEKEIELFDDAYLNGAFYYNIDTIKANTLKEITYIKDGDRIQFGQEPIIVYETPGHTRGSVTYKYKEDLYTGDTLFRGTVGKWDFPTGSQQTLKETIIKLFRTLDHKLNVYPGHGDNSTIGDEVSNNHFFNFWKDGKDFPSTVTTQNDLFNAARKLFDNRDFNEAKVIFDKIQSSEPENYFISVYVNYCEKMIKGA